MGRVAVLFYINPNTKEETKRENRNPHSGMSQKLVGSAFLLWLARQVSCTVAVARRGMSWGHVQAGQGQGWVGDHLWKFFHFADGEPGDSRW